MFGVKRLLQISVLTTAVSVLVATPVSAHGSEPKNTVSEIESVTPQPEGASFSIAAGDAFMVIKVREGHTADIPGYSDEPYLRVLADGTVEENQTSPATLLNKSRYGDVGSATLDPTLEPQWKVIARNGEVAWHDHRIHWMARTTPATIDADGTIQQWAIDLFVDGEGVEISGRLMLRDEPSFAWWLLCIPAGLVALLVRRRRLLPIGLGVLGVSLAAIDGLRMLSLPSIGRQTPTVGIAGAVTVVIAAVALLNRREKYAGAVTAGMGTAACLASYVGIDWITKAVLPGMVQEWLARGTVVLLAGAGAAALYIGVTEALKINQQ